MDSDDSEERKSRHLQLASIVKGVHSKLRSDLEKHNGDFEGVWKNHVQNHELLNEYAGAMAELSEDHWSRRPDTRIDWCYSTCKEYFFQGGLLQQLHKDRRRLEHKRRREQSSDWEVAGRLSISENSDADSPVSSPYRVPQSNPLQAAQRNLLLQRSRSHEDARINQRLLMPPPAAPPAAVLGTSAPTSRPSSLQTSTAPPQHHTLLVGQSPKISIPKVVSPVESSGGEGSLDSAGTLHKLLVQNKVLPPSPNLTSPVADSCQSSRDSAVEFVTSMTQPEAETEQRKLQQNFCTQYSSHTIEYPFRGKIRLLDVGSCNNLFNGLSEFITVALDICPAKETPEVFQGDFLYLEVTDPLELAKDSFESYLKKLDGSLTAVPKHSFHVVVFSMVLEYFPAPYQRWLCCVKAHQLLMLNGLLLIVTPDSSKLHKNSQQMKAWKKCIEAIGFSRWRYIKQEHVHCMAFRKTTAEPEQDLRAESDPSNMYIPQDKQASSDPTSYDVWPEDEEWCNPINNHQGFCELPHCLDEEF